LASPPCHLTRLLQDKIFLLPSHRIADDCSPDEVRSDKEKKELGVPGPPGKIVGGRTVLAEASDFMEAYHRLWRRAVRSFL
jgi:hypothetical protein